MALFEDAQYQRRLVNQLSGGSIGLAGGIGLAQQQMTYPSYFNQTASTNTMSWVKEPKKDVCKSGCSLLHKLRQEISDWHGDILMRVA